MQRDFSCEAVEIGAHDIEHAADLGVMPEFLGGGLFVPPRIPQRLDRDVDADAVAKTETVGHGFGDAIDGNGHALDDVRV